MSAPHYYLFCLPGDNFTYILLDIYFLNSEFNRSIHSVKYSVYSKNNFMFFLQEVKIQVVFIKLSHYTIIFDSATIRKTSNSLNQLLLVVLECLSFTIIEAIRLHIICI